MQWSLFVLILMGQVAFITCNLYDYRFINKSKNWTEAQSYCRTHHTDLATVTHMADMNRLREVNKSRGEAWIGLRNEPGKENRTWHWSQPGLEYRKNETNWAGGEPNNKAHNEDCVIVGLNGWNDVPCTAPYEFICYNETMRTFYHFDEQKNWTEAQRYCREHHTDLVSGVKQLNSDEYKNKSKEINWPEEAWIGLFTDSWRWSDQSSFSFRNWAPESQITDLPPQRGCAVTQNGTWQKENCGEEKPFFCYEDHTILIKENMTWVDALYYCREKHRDLVSITSPDQQMWVQEKAKQANSRYVWMGLRYTCTLGFWFWVTNERLTYMNWEPPVETDDCDMSGAMNGGGEHKWVKETDEREFNFICWK